MGRFQRNFLLLFIAAALTTVSFILVFMSANDEPYLSYRRADVTTQVIASTVVATLWICYLLLIPALILSGHISYIWVLMLFWGFLCGAFVGSRPGAYLDDMERFILQLRP